MEIAEFLLARFADDEEVARALLADYGSIAGWLERDHDSAAEQVAALDLAPWLSRFDPAHVLAECAAKRRIVERLADLDAHFADTGRQMPDMRSALLVDGILADLALLYADHPSYREEWKP